MTFPIELVNNYNPIERWTDIFGVGHAPASQKPTNMRH